MTKAMEITSVSAGIIHLPWAVGLLDLPAVTKNAIVVDHNCIVIDLEADPSRPRIIRILYQLVGEGPIPLQVAQFGAQVTKVIDTSGQIFGGTHLMIPSAAQRYLRSHVLQIDALERLLHLKKPCTMMVLKA